MSVQIQSGPANEVERYSQDKAGWETIAEGNDAMEALTNLLTDMNSEAVDVENNFFRLIVGDEIINL